MTVHQQIHVVPDKYACYWFSVYIIKFQVLYNMYIEYCISPTQHARGKNDHKQEDIAL